MFFFRLTIHCRLESNNFATNLAIVEYFYEMRQNGEKTIRYRTDEPPARLKALTYPAYDAHILIRVLQTRLGLLTFKQRLRPMVHLLVIPGASDSVKCGVNFPLLRRSVRIPTPSPVHVGIR